MVGQYKQRSTDYIDTVGVCYNNHKYTNEGLHYFQLVMKKDGGLIFKGEDFLELMIWFTHINVGTSRDSYISSSLNVEVSYDQQRFFINTNVEYLNARDIALAAVGKGYKKKIIKRKLESLG